ncbi:PEGA domain-containing protein [Flagellimonas sp.]|uniref:PEGA domain-containing protein n=1 Tax=Flagellimonas sp. TaxID=2058762 RepID=UPI003BABA542
MRKTIILSISLVIITSLSFGSCATLFGKKSHALAVGSDPAGAEVYVNGFKMGNTPLELNLKADKGYTIEYRKEGYQSVTRIVNTKVGAGFRLDEKNAVINDGVCMLLLNGAYPNAKTI